MSSFTHPRSPLRREVDMPLFLPPVKPYLSMGDVNSLEPAKRLMAYFPVIEMGETVWKDAEGAWHSQQFPFHGQVTRVFNDGELVSESESPGLRNAQQVYLGGHIYHVDDETADELEAAGFEMNTVSPLTFNWWPDQMPLLYNQVMTVNPPNVPAAPAAEQVDGVSHSFFKLDSGQTNFSNRRDFWLHDGTSGWTDLKATLDIIDPAFYGTHPDLGQILPQGGLVLRFQVDEDAGKVRGITLNNNIFFVVPNLNVGVWQADLDGTNFQNRQGGIALADIPGGFPYGIDAELVGNVVTVTALGSEGNFTKVVDLDTDAGDTTDFPTPTGPGASGWIAAHTGTHPLSAVRLGKTVFERLDET